LPPLERNLELVRTLRVVGRRNGEASSTAFIVVATAPTAEPTLTQEVVFLDE
jgi:hypothetical protein